VLENLIGGFSNLLNIEMLATIVVGLSLGVFLGAIPGLGAVIGVGVLLPVTYTMSASTAIVLLITIFKGAMVGGSFSSILINTPGTAAAAATTFDGYPLCMKGHSKKALQAAICGSVFADLISTIILITGSAFLARATLKFGPTELFWVIAFSLILTAGLAGKSIWKGLIAMGIGLLFGTIGLDPVVNLPRLGVIPILGKLEGLDMVAFMLGAFAISEIFINIENLKKGKNITNKKFHEIYGPSISLSEVIESIKAFIIGTIMGTIIGIIPGMGATAATFLSYGTAKQLYNGKSKGVKFGEGVVPGVVVAESANNASAGSSTLPLLTLGIPGSSIAAMIGAAFMLHGITPGPGIFVNHGPVVYSIFAAFLFANPILLILSILLLKPITKVLRSNLNMTFPVVMIICFAGVYSINQRITDLGVMVFIGVLAYIMKKIEMPIPPMVISFILSINIERYFRQSLAMSGGNYDIFFSSTICKILCLLTLILIPLVITQSIKEKRDTEEKGKLE